MLLSAGKVEGATVLLWGHPEKVFKKAVWILEGMMNVVMDLMLCQVPWEERTLEIVGTRHISHGMFF